ncbi:MAG: hypothetical protein ACRD3W_08435, partial [Terriglobales bacterium]
MTAPFATSEIPSGTTAQTGTEVNPLQQQGIAATYNPYSQLTLRAPTAQVVNGDGTMTIPPANFGSTTNTGGDALQQIVNPAANPAAGTTDGQTVTTTQTGTPATTTDGQTVATTQTGTPATTTDGQTVATTQTGTPTTTAAGGDAGFI